MLSLELPSVNAAMQYLKNLEHGGMMGGSPQINKPDKNNGKQAMDSGNHSNVKIHRINMLTNPEVTVNRLICSSSILNFSFTTSTSIVF